VQLPILSSARLHGGEKDALCVRFSLSLSLLLCAGVARENWLSASYRRGWLEETQLCLGSRLTLYYKVDLI
jgi:hypothetical protein